MVSLTLNKKRLFQDLGRAESQDVYDSIVMMGVEVDAIEGAEITVDITPNRPDLLSQAGFTRALRSFLGVGERPAYTTTRSKLKVVVEDAAKGIRPYTACAIAKDLSLDDAKLKEIIDLQEKLHVTFCRRRKKAAIGVYPMEAIKGNIRFTALPPEEITFQPLESEKEMTAAQILEKHPKGKEYAHLLQGMVRYPVFLDGKGDVLSMPPIINSVKTGKVTEKTKEIFIEASGHDFRTCHEIIRIICAALADMGASIQTVDVHYGRRIETTPDMSTSRQEFYRYYVNRRLGTSLTKEQLPDLLAKMGLGFEDGRIKETHYAIIPPYRVDFLHQIDVVEDIAIALGYDKIVPEIPALDTVAAESESTKRGRLLRQILAGYGLLEAKEYHLINATYQREILAQDGLVTLKSSVSEEYDSLRAAIIPGLLLALARNKTHEYPQRLFEIGSVFAPADRAVSEQECVAGVFAAEDYTRAKQVVDGMLTQLGVVAGYAPAQHSVFMQGRCAAITIDGKTVGFVGEVTPSALARAGISVPCAAFELHRP